MAMLSGMVGINIYNNPIDLVHIRLNSVGITSQRLYTNIFVFNIKVSFALFPSPDSLTTSGVTASGFGKSEGA